MKCLLPKQMQCNKPYKAFAWCSRRSMLHYWWPFLFADADNIPVAMAVQNLDGPSQVRCLSVFSRPCT